MSSTTTSNRRSNAVLPPQTPTTTTTLSPEATSKFELGLTLILNTWQALTVAVQNEWGGPDSADKRDWMCGAVAELFGSRPSTDNLDLEDFLSQILEDEFDVVVEDGSTILVSNAILKIRNECSMGDFATVDRLNTEWLERRPAKVNVVRGGEEEDSGDDEEDGEGEGMDIDMEGEEAPELVRVRERPERVVDEDGFELVQKGRRRR